jgi:hypothetical protein
VADISTNGPNTRDTNPNTQGILWNLPQASFSRGYRGFFGVKEPSSWGCSRHNTERTWE